MKIGKFLTSFLTILSASALLHWSAATAEPVKTNLYNQDNEFLKRYHIVDGRRVDNPLWYLSSGINRLLYPSFKNKQPYPNDPYYKSTGSWGQPYADLWGIKKINVNKAWGLYKGQGITIAIVDSGINFWHEDITANLFANSKELFGLPGFDDDGNGFMDDISGWDFVDNDSYALDLYGHGTHLAGIAAATGNNKRGIIGVAPLANVLSVRVLDQYGGGTIENVANGIRYAASMGAKIINLSFGGFVYDVTLVSLLQDAVDFAINRGSIIVAAAGNSSTSLDHFVPADLTGVIAVGATDPYDNRASFSNYNNDPNDFFIMAPGVDILSLGSKKAYIGQAVSKNYYLSSGTSMSAPFVSGAIALLLNKYPNASLNDIKTLLANGAVDLGDPGWDPYYGYGRLDVAKSLGITSSTSAQSSGAGFTLTVTTTSLPLKQTSAGVKNSAVEEILQKNAVHEDLGKKRKEISFMNRMSYKNFLEERRVE